ncbi:MAG: phage holin family protein [Hyphomonadaceae bacterium]|nr:phage holin family protein [Hyphomonadaceae bacterium]
MQTDRSFSDLTKDVAFHLGDMFRNELKLAKVEASEGAKSLSSAMGLYATAAAVGASALTLALLAAAYGLSTVLPMWAAALIVAIPAFLIAFILMQAGKAAMTPKDLSLPRTREHMSRDIKTISEHVH